MPGVFYSRSASRAQPLPAGRYDDPATEICLLFKAKAVRDRDRADFEAALPRMSPAQRAWLHSALVRVHPDHDWISATE